MLPLAGDQVEGEILQVAEPHPHVAGTGDSGRIADGRCWRHDLLAEDEVHQA